MKLITILIFGFFMQVSASGNSQNVTFQGKNVPLSTIFKAFHDQTGYNFLYTYELIERAGNRDIDLKNVPFVKALNICLEGSNLSYMIMEGTVLIQAKSPISSKSFWEQVVQDTRITIGGIVTGENGQPLEGVSVVVKGTNKGTSTNSSGRYSISVDGENIVLVFSMVGYKIEEIEVKKRTTINVKLVQVITSMDEMIVVGYGQADKLTYTGSVSTIGANDIIKNNTVNVADALVGRLSGITVVRPYGAQPGSKAFITVRGMNTINDASHNNDPLIIIDGVERTSLQDDVLSLIDPNDIENISVLKDASAAAVYGARSANGVILITTKRGNTSRPEISYNFVFQNQRPTRLPKPLNSWEWATLYNEAQTNDARLPDGSIPSTFKPLYSKSDIQKFKDGSDPDHFANTNWFKEILKPSADEQQHNLSLRGGNNAAKYFVSFGYADQGGFIETYNFKRYNLRSNLDIDINKTLKLSVDLAGTFSQTNSPSYDGVSDLLKTSPIYPNRLNSDPSKYGAVQNANSIYNPYLQVYKSGYNNTDNTTVFSSLNATQQIVFIPGLSVSGLLSFNISKGTGKIWRKNPTLFTDDGLYYKEGVFSGASLQERYLQYKSITMEGRINYDQQFGKHHVGGLLLFSQTKNGDRQTTAAKVTFLSTALDELFVGEVEGQQIIGSASQLARQGLVGRITYNYEQRYLVEGNFRYDGSSNFPRNHRWGFFPSFSLGWNIAKENFIKDNLAFSFINRLKIRGSWGILGNDWVGFSPFPYLNQFNFGYTKITIGNKLVSMVTPSAIANPDITWEKATTSNIGLEAMFWNGLLGIEIDGFIKRTTEILAQPTLAVPQTFGASLPLLNQAIVENSGFEISLSHEQHLEKFYYRIKPNITFSSSRIVYMPENQVNENLRRSGRTQDYYGFGYQAIGLFQSYEEIEKSPVQTFGNVQPGDIKYADISGPAGVPDGRIDAFDRTRIGNSSVPKITYGVALDAGYGSFDFSALLQGVGRSSLNFSGDPGWAFASQLLVVGSVYEHHRDRWTPENTGASYPRLFLNNNNNKQTSSYWIKDANYLRVKSISLGYTFSKDILSKIKIDYLRIFAGATNLFTWDKVKIYDPEIRGVFSTGASYPVQKVFSIGLNLRF